MTLPSAMDAELRELIAALREGTLSAEEAVRLNGLLSDSPSAREIFACHALLQATLELALGPAEAEKGTVPACATTNAARRRRPSDRSGELDLSPSPPPIIVVQTDAAPPSSPFSFQSFVGSSLFSYLVATVIAAVAFSIAWGWKTSRDWQVARSSAEQTAPVEQPQPEMPLVGRITGVADCQWANAAAAACERDGVHLGREYALVSGFLEITYDSGAKVILQGPATYQVESRSGGFLALGKLTARVERGSKGERTVNRHFLAEKVEPTTSLAPRPSPFFFVRTPTAVVTDLGTEFGVEVDRSGGSQAYVFHGKVELRLTDGDGQSLPSLSGRGVGGEGSSAGRGTTGGGSGRAVQLTANQSARVERGADRIVTLLIREPGELTFARQMPRRQPGVAGPIAKQPPSPPAYRLTDLGALAGGVSSEAYDINAAGQVVGVSTAKNGSRRGFLYTNGAVKDLGPLGGPHDSVYDINTRGQVVGTATFNGSRHAFLYSGGTMKDLGTLGGAGSDAFDVSDEGQVVGAAQTSSGASHAFLYRGGRMTDLGTLGADSCAYYVNSKGRAAGFSVTPGGAHHAALYDGNGAVRDLGTLGGPDSFAYFVGDDGLVVGASTTADGATHGFAYRAGAISDLGTLGGPGSDAVRANAHGQIVGWSDTAAGAQHAFLYRDHMMIDLNSLVDAALGWVLVMTTGINDSGQIVGNGTAPDGAVRAFLLTPAQVVARSPDRANVAPGHGQETVPQQDRAQETPAPQRQAVPTDERRVSP